MKGDSRKDRSQKDRAEGSGEGECNVSMEIIDAAIDSSINVATMGALLRVIGTEETVDAETIRNVGDMIHREASGLCTSLRSLCSEEMFASSRDQRLKRKRGDRR